MTVELALRLNIMRLYNGRRSFYASLTIGRRRFFVSRWDSVRVHPIPLPGQFTIHRGPVMTWYGGRAVQS
jgi:hypothetical protein